MCTQEVHVLSCHFIFLHVMLVFRLPPHEPISSHVRVWVQAHETQKYTTLPVHKHKKYTTRHEFLGLFLLYWFRAISTWLASNKQFIISAPGMIPTLPISFIPRSPVTGKALVLEASIKLSTESLPINQKLKRTG